MTNLEWIEIECPTCGLVGLRSLSPGQTTERYSLCTTCRKKKKENEAENPWKEQ